MAIALDRGQASAHAVLMSTTVLRDTLDTEALPGFAALHRRVSHAVVAFGLAELQFRERERWSIVGRDREAAAAGDRAETYHEEAFGILAKARDELGGFAANLKDLLADRSPEV